MSYDSILINCVLFYYISYVSVLNILSKYLDNYTYCYLKPRNKNEKTWCQQNIEAIFSVTNFDSLSKSQKGDHTKSLPAAFSENKAMA